MALGVVSVVSSIILVVGLLDPFKQGLLECPLPKFLAKLYFFLVVAYVILALPQHPLLLLRRRLSFDLNCTSTTEASLNLGAKLVDDVNAGYPVRTIRVAALAAAFLMLSRS